MKIDNILDIEKNKKIETYHCGSLNLYSFLISNGHVPVNSYVSNKKNRKRVIWIFIKSKELKKLLVQWTNGKPKGGVKNGE